MSQSQDTVVAAAVRTRSPSPSAPQEILRRSPKPSTRKPRSYGATDDVPSLHVQIATPEPGQFGNGNGYGFSGFDDDLDDMEDVGGESRVCAAPQPPGRSELMAESWRFMSRFYVLVPLTTLAFFAGLIALVTWGWCVAPLHR